MTYAGRFVAPGETFRLHRGDPMQRKEPVTPGGLKTFGRGWSLPGNASDADRRVALAKWITDPANPLTARVLVNRIWHYHFGTGIVDTPSDFGINGGRPTHPELLDWLASEFVASGWSIKALHRTILTSRTYRQGARLARIGMAVDASDRFLWRYPPRRLEAEPAAGRDPVGGGDDESEGRGARLQPLRAEHELRPGLHAAGRLRPRRAAADGLPGEAPRGARHALRRFDCPDAGQIAPRRNLSTTPLQAARDAQQRIHGATVAGLRRALLRARPGTSVDQQVRLAFSLAFRPRA